MLVLMKLLKTAAFFLQKYINIKYKFKISPIKELYVANRNSKFYYVYSAMLFA